MYTRRSHFHYAGGRLHSLSDSCILRMFACRAYATTSFSPSMTSATSSARRDRVSRVQAARSSRAVAAQRWSHPTSTRSRKRAFCSRRTTFSRRCARPHARRCSLAGDRMQHKCGTSTREPIPFGCHIGSSTYQSDCCTAWEQVFSRSGAQLHNNSRVLPAARLRNSGWGQDLSYVPPPDGDMSLDANPVCALGRTADPGHASGVNSTAARAAPPGACPPNNRGACSDDQLFSWSHPYFHSADSAYTGPTSDNPAGLSWKSVSPAEEAAHPLSDTQIADNAVKMLDQFRARDLGTPFFLACGFRTRRPAASQSLLH